MKATLILKTKVMKIKFLFTAFLILAVSIVSAQSLESWTWDTYKMKFKVPNNFKVSDNDATKFSAGNGNLHLTIYPRKDEELTYETMQSALRKWARSNNVNYEGEVKYMKSLNEYWGVYIDGTGSNGLPTSLLLLVDPDYTTNSFYIWLQYQRDYFDTAVDILKSFTPN
jgi:hypothetical protein